MFLAILVLVYLSLVRVGPDEAWRKSTRFKVLADGVPVVVTFSRREPVYESRGVKLGMEETLGGRVAAADLKRLSRSLVGRPPRLPNARRPPALPKRSAVAPDLRDHIPPVLDFAFARD